MTQSESPLAHRSKKLRLEPCLHLPVATYANERIPGSNMCPGASCRSCWFAFSCRHYARADRRPPTLIPGTLFRVSNAVVRNFCFLHRNLVSSRLREILGRCVPATPVDRVECPMPLGDVERGAGDQRVVFGPFNI